MQIINTNASDDLLKDKLHSISMTWSIQNKFRSNKYKFIPNDRVEYNGGVYTLHGYTGILVQWNPNYNNLLFIPDDTTFKSKYLKSNALGSGGYYIEKYNAFYLSAHIFIQLNIQDNIIYF